LINIE